MFRWKNGEKVAFEELYRKYSVPLLKIAYKKTNDFESAEEIVQDVFVAFYNSRDNIKNNPALYLKGILKHKIFDHARKGSIKILSLGEYGPAYNKEASGNIFNDFFAKELDKKIRITIEQLPQQCKTIFLMSRNDNMTYTEIAERLGISVKTVEAHISKALKYLREHLDYQLFLFALLFIGL